MYQSIFHYCFQRLDMQGPKANCYSENLEEQEMQDWKERWIFNWHSYKVNSLAWAPFSPSIPVGPETPEGPWIQ